MKDVEEVATGSSKPVQVADSAERRPWEVSVGLSRSSARLDRDPPLIFSWKTC